MESNLDTHAVSRSLYIRQEDSYPQAFPVCSAGTAQLMQTFLPYPGFAASAAVLDERRLGKQRVEALQVLRALTRPGYGWQHHPAVRMWRGREEALAAYGLAMAAEWCRRGHPDTCASTIRADLAAAGFDAEPRGEEALASAGAMPWWLGDPAVHASHRAALVRKDPDHYAALFPDADPQLPYVWPAAEPAA